MPWQLSGNGRSGWSTKLIRGLKAEAAAGFQSRRERCREPTPVTPQYAAFPTYKAARVHRDSRRRGGWMAPCGARAADGEGVANRYAGNHIVGSEFPSTRRLPATTTAAWLCRGAKPSDRVPFS